ncbi:hypothetical protein JCM14036_01320 [Desulfotomaculum defluvii]
MVKIKAVVMAHREKYKNTLVYTEDGQYLTTRIKPEPQVGSTIYVNQSSIMAKPKMLVVAAAVLLILFTGLMPNFAPTPAAAAYVNLAWQPEIGLWVDGEGKVTQANIVGLPNEDFGTTLKGQDLYSALSELLQYSQEQGYLEKKQSMVIGTLIKTNEQNLPDITEQQLKDFLYSQLEKQGYQGALVVTVQKQEILKTAEKAGMPLGKYVVYENSRQQNQPVKLDLLKQQDVLTALSQAGVKGGDIFGHHYMEVNEHMHEQGSPMENGTMITNPIHQQSSLPATRPSEGTSSQTQMHTTQGTMNHSVMQDQHSSSTSHDTESHSGHMGMNRHQ